MIHIIFISPDAFEALGKQFGEHDGLGDLRELLFPRRSEPNVLIADPHKENWFNETMQRAKQLPSQSRLNAMELLRKLYDQSLVGWASHGAAPANENDWVKLVGSNKKRHVDYVFASDISLCNAIVESVARISDDAWLKVQFPWSKSITRCRSSQLPIFQNLLLDSDWCIAELPYLKGSSDDEIVTLKQLIDVISDLPRTQPYELDLVTKLEEKPTYWAKNVKAELREALSQRPQIKVRVFALANHKDRYFTVGSTATIAGGQPKREVRRCIAAQHVAVRPDRPTESNTWSLCNLVDTKNRFEKLTADMAAPGALAFELP
jgi:hypothetical protein